MLTFVGAYDERQVAAAIRRELLRDGQVFYVHNRVSTIERAAREYGLAVLGGSTLSGCTGLPTLNPRALERDGVVIRTVYPSAPVRIEYRLSTSARHFLSHLRPCVTGRSTISTAVGTEGPRGQRRRCSGPQL